MPKYKAAAACWLKADGHAAPCRIEPGEVFSYSGTQSVAMIPLDAEARAAKRRLLPDVWPATAQPSDTMRVGLGLGARHTSNLTERRRIIENFLRENPLEKVSA